MIFPSQTVQEKDKLKPEWGSMHLDYAQSLLMLRNGSTVMNRLYQGYNGEKTGQEFFRQFTHTYGLENKSKMVSYRLGRNKIDLLNGEYLKRPIKATIETVNSDAKTAKMEQADFMRGAMASQEELAKLKEVGVDVTEGMPIPQSEEDPIWMKMSFKDRNEEIMQIICNNAIKELGIQWKTAKNFLDCEIVATCYGKVDISDEGKIEYYPIDPRDAIFVEIENDPFLERSPIKGSRMRMTLSEVLAKYPLKDDQIKIVEAAKNSTQTYNNKKFQTYNYKGGDLCVDVIHIEWRSNKPEYFKLSPKTNKQMLLDPSTPYYVLPLGVDKYENNSDNFVIVQEIQDEKKFLETCLSIIANGKIPVLRKYKEDVWEATRIAGCIDTQVRRKFFQMRKNDNKAYVLDLSYVGYLHQTVDGIRISLQQTLENFDNIFDIVMYQILKELNSSKGRYLLIDAGLLKTKTTAKDVAYDITNHGFHIVDSSQDGQNQLNGLDITKLIHQGDLGFSSAFQQLLLLKDHIRNEIDRISGINENREGYSKASDTVTNVQASTAASRTITEPLFFGFSLFVEKLLMKICEASKIIYAFQDKEKGRQILGDNKTGFLEVLQSIGYQDYGVFLEDGGRYAELMAEMNEAMAVSLNNKEITMADFVKAKNSDTYHELVATFEDALKRVQDIAIQQQQAEQEHQAQMMQQQQQMQAQSQQSANEQKLGHDVGKIQAKGQATLAIDNQKAINTIHLDNNRAHNKILENASKK